MSAAWRRPSRASGALLLVVSVIAVSVVSIATGASGLPLSVVVDVLLGGGDDIQRSIVLDLRLPRIVTGLIAGGALAVSGATFQALLRNPLAEPYILGVAGGAAVCAVGFIVLVGAAAAEALLPAAAFIGALLAIGLVLRLASRVGRPLDSRVLLLSGVMVSAFFNAIILMLLTFADVESFRSAIFWMMGSLAAASWRTALLMLVYVVPAMIVLLALARSFNLLAAGEDIALYLGVSVQRVKIIAYLVASLIVAATVATCGVVGFVGLVVPHAIRLVWGGDHRFLLPASFVAGGGFLLIADTLARTIVSPTELPVGVVTALIGVPIFIVLLRKNTA